MKKILVFAGSNSSTSINHQLVSSVASQIKTHHVKVIKLADYALPMFGEDLEREEGNPERLSQLLEEIKQVDGLIISVNEHNGTVSAFFKNVLDWLSRIEYKFLAEKQLFLMSASPGKRGGLSSYQYVESVLPRFGGSVTSGFSFPSFAENFSEEKEEITNAELKATLQLELSKFLDALN